MGTTNYTAAKSEIYGILKAVVDTQAAPIVGIVPIVRYMGKDDKTVPPVDRFWIEVSLQTLTERQSGFGVSSRLYTTRGNMFAKLYIPSTVPNGLERGEKLAQAIKTAYRPRASAGNVWYRETRIQELPMEKGAYRLNVITTYTYDERN